MDELAITDFAAVIEEVVHLLTSIGTPRDVIICSNDDMALGAAEALQQAGIQKGKVMVIGFDAFPEPLAKIRSGDQTATIEQSSDKQIRTAMEIIVDHIRKKTPLHDEAIKPFLVDKTNLDKAERIGEAKVEAVGRYRAEFR